MKTLSKTRIYEGVQADRIVKVLSKMDTDARSRVDEDGYEIISHLMYSRVIEIFLGYTDETMRVEIYDSGLDRMGWIPTRKALAREELYAKARREARSQLAEWEVA